jgi:DNA-binding GntR family transcriptional regulator
MAAKDKVYTSLRKKILSGKLESDTPLIESKLAKEYGVSRTPVREALRQLVSERLVRIVPNIGAFVGCFTWGEAREMFVVRTLLESFAAQLTTSNISEGVVEKLIEILDQQREAVKNNDFVSYEVLDDAFHSFLIQHSGNGQLSEVISQLNDRTKLADLRHSMFSNVKNLQVSLREHEDIVDSIIGRNPGDVARLVWAHGRRFYGESVDAKMPKKIFITSN